MGINTPILDAGATSSRKDNDQLYIKRAGQIPPASYQEVVDGVVVTIDQTPERVGQFVYFRPFDRPGYDPRVTMYVVVEVPGLSGLHWRQVVHEPTFTNPYAGVSYNQMNNVPGFYRQTMTHLFRLSWAGGEIIRTELTPPIVF